MLPRESEGVKCAVSYRAQLTFLNIFTESLGICNMLGYCSNLRSYFHKSLQQTQLAGISPEFLLVSIEWSRMVLCHCVNLYEKPLDTKTRIEVCTHFPKS